ncbi:MAG: UbiA-like polyprenyltransferase [Elusimicrobiota bacterium]|jgi:4-hydroxybenzoate polyprenyltransferase
MNQRLLAYGRLVKVEHTLFSIPLLFSGAVLAAGHLPSWSLSVLILFAGFGARTAAFALNRIIDRHIDKLNPRTAGRELPKGSLTVAEAWGVGVFGTLLYGVAAWFIAPICFYLSPLPLVVFVLYPYLKRVSWMAHFGVGLADALAPLGGWIAVTQSLHPVWPGLWLGLFTFFWVSGFDIIYSTMDETFDREHGLHSLPVRVGSEDALLVSGVFHMVAFWALVALYKYYFHSTTAFLTLGAIGALLYLEHANARDVNLAFFKINAVLGFGVLGFIVTGVLFA